MGSDSRKAHQKRLARLRKVATKKKHEEARQKEIRIKRDYETKYPAFEYEEGDAPKAFIDLVRTATSTIRLDDRRIFTEVESAFYRTIKKDGAKAAYDVFGKSESERFGLDRPGPNYWIQRQLGQLIFGRIPQHDLLRYIPFHDFVIGANRHRILVAFRSLCRQETSQGPFYYSKHKPIIKVNGQQRIVGFHEHLVERVCERVVPGGWNDYLGMGEAFGYLYECEYFEPVTLHPNQIGFSFYDDCAKGFWSRRIAKAVLGENYDDNDVYSYRVGYCPSFISGDFIVGKTLLVPGYGNTPEFGKILSSPLSEHGRSKLIKATEDFTVHRLVDTNDFSLVKWFHEQGVPQVINRRTKYTSF